MFRLPGCMCSSWSLQQCLGFGKGQWNSWLYIIVNVLECAHSYSVYVCLASPGILLLEFEQLWASHENTSRMLMCVRGSDPTLYESVSSQWVTNTVCVTQWSCLSLSVSWEQIVKRRLFVFGAVHKWGCAFLLFAWLLIVLYWMLQASALFPYCPLCQLLGAESWVWGKWRRDKGRESWPCIKCNGFWRRRGGGREVF